MVEILHRRMPDDLEPDARLPGVKPLDAEGWLRCDEAYGAQMAYRRKLLAERRQDMLWEGDAFAHSASAELLKEALHLMPGLGFRVSGEHIHCPDGAAIVRYKEHPLAVLGHTLQQDFCILLKREDVHYLAAAVLCFPASWTLREKAGRPLMAIHAPVAAYDEAIGKRVQRLFDGVKVGKPLWRNNMLYYDDPDLFQPRSENDPQRAAPVPNTAAYLRAERQCIFRLPNTGAVVFSIHSYVTKP